MSMYIKEIQAELRDKGFFTDPINGVACEATLEAANKAASVGVLTEAARRAIEEQCKSCPELNSKQVEADTSQSGFSLSNASLQRLAGVNEDLARVVKLAITKTKQDFKVLEGLRTKEQQAKNVARGMSQTMDSKHLAGKAVDLVPVVDGEVSWDWKYYYPIAEAMREAAKELNVTIRWGGAWVVLNTTTEPTVKLVTDYVNLRRKQGRKAFTDGPHYEVS